MLLQDVERTNNDTWEIEIENRKARVIEWAKLF